MYLKNDKIVVKVGSVTMTSSKLGLPAELILDPSAVSGWTDGVQVRRDGTIRLGRHGDFMEPSTLSARLIEFSGTAIATSMAELQGLRDRLVGVLREGVYESLSVETMTDRRYVTVGLEGRPSWIRQTDTTAVFKIAFYAPDPFIYGETNTIQAGATTTESDGGLKYALSYPLNYSSTNTITTNGTVTNRGNAEAWPRFVVSGDYFSGFTITNNRDKRVTYTGAVYMAAPVEIDMARGTAIQGGIDRTILLKDRDFFSVAPGEVMKPKFTPLAAGSGWCDIIIRDTWI